MADKYNTLYSPYGAFELKSKYQRNFFFASSITTGFIVFILLTFWLVGVIKGEEKIFVAGKIIKTIADLGPPPTVAKKPPQVKVDKPNVAKPKVGIPKPVADDELLDDDVVLATKEELADIVAPDITAGDGDFVVDIDEDDYLPGMDEFVPVEIMPEMIYEVTPVYPRMAKQAGLDGYVWIKALVGKDGSVLEAVVAKTSGNGSLDDAALAVAKQYRYKPGIQNGRPVAVWVTYKVNFVLNN